MDRLAFNYRRYDRQRITATPFQAIHQEHPEATADHHAHRVPPTSFQAIHQEHPEATADHHAHHAHHAHRAHREPPTTLKIPLKLSKCCKST